MHNAHANDRMYTVALPGHFNDPDMLQVLLLLRLSLRFQRLQAILVQGQFVATICAILW